MSPRKERDILTIGPREFKINLTDRYSCSLRKIVMHRLQLEKKKAKKTNYLSRVHGIRVRAAATDEKSTD